LRTREKLFIGPRVKALREARGWTLSISAQHLGVSISYLSQIEANQRPVTARIIAALSDTFGVPAAALDADDGQRLVADLREALADDARAESPVTLSEIRQVALQSPAFARRYLDLHRAFHRLDERLKLADEAVGLDEAVAASALLPYEEVRDFFNDKNNYLDALDCAAEALSARLDLESAASSEAALAAWLLDEMQVTVSLEARGETMRRYDPQTRVLALNPAQSAQTRTFQMAFHLVAHALADLIEAELAQAGFLSPEAVDVCRMGLGNYAAGALVMPYRRFAQAARELRHDVEQLALRFHTSLEQVCHRLSTLQRPGERGVPMYFVRVDAAGSITKRHSATRFRFARFGGTCPLWNVHEAVGAAAGFHVQVAEMPDGVRYLCVARTVRKFSGAYLTRDRRYVLGFGCELQYADAFVYSQGVDLKAPPEPIGVSCRICEREDCAQRAFPPVDKRLAVSPHERAVVPFRLLKG
jgi:predicted transcriptional regulator/transcriptional regulator with XRE-family HTH domain